MEKSFLSEDEIISCLKNFWGQMRDNELLSLRISFEDKSKYLSKEEHLQLELERIEKLITEAPPTILDEVVNNIVNLNRGILSEERLKAEVEITKASGGEFTEEDFQNMESDNKNFLIVQFWTAAEKTKEFSDSYRNSAHHEFLGQLKKLEKEFKENQS